MIVKVLSNISPSFSKVALYLSRIGLFNTKSNPSLFISKAFIISSLNSFNNASLKGKLSKEKSSPTLKSSDFFLSHAIGFPILIEKLYSLKTISASALSLLLSQ